MSAEHTNPHQEPWPNYFELIPNTGHEAAPRVPLALIDAFYLQPNASGATTFVGVVGCQDGSLRAVTDGNEQDPLGPVADQVEAVRVGQRGLFRGIASERLGLLSISAVEQNMATRGFNDPVTLYGPLTTVAGTGAEHGGASQQGRLVVGRIDLLRAYRSGIEHAFRSPDPNNLNAYMTPLLLPVAQHHGRGDEAVLAYPAFDPMIFQFGDNGSITRHIVYDLLVRLQADMREEGLRHPFIDHILPVPSRKRLEAELSVDGYQIDGDEAVKTAPQTTSQAKGLLGRLRAMTQGWSAPRITLPPEATDADYAGIIDEVMAAVQTSHDRAAASLAAQMVRAQVAYTPPRAQQTPTYQRPAATPVAQRPTQPPRRTPPAPTRPDYSHVFAIPPPTQTEAEKIAARRQQWEELFDITSHMPVRGSSNASPVSSETQQAQADDKWADVFATPAAPASTQPPAPTDKWADVFTPQPTQAPARPTDAPKTPDKKKKGGKDWSEIFKPQ